MKPVGVTYLLNEMCHPFGVSILHVVHMLQSCHPFGVNNKFFGAIKFPHRGVLITASLSSTFMNDADSIVSFSAADSMQHGRVA
jgi:hypothetical protein